MAWAGVVAFVMTAVVACSTDDAAPPAPAPSATSSTPTTPSASRTSTPPATATTAPTPTSTTTPEAAGLAVPGFPAGVDDEEVQRRQPPSRPCAGAQRRLHPLPRHVHKRIVDNLRDHERPDHPGAAPGTRPEPRLHRPGRLHQRPRPDAGAGLPRPARVRRTAHGLPQSRAIVGRPTVRTRPAARLHRGRDQRGPRPADLAVRRSRADRTARPVDGRRGHLQRARHATRSGEGRGRVRAGQLRRGRQLQPLDRGTSARSRPRSCARTANRPATRPSGGTSPR